MTSSENLEKWFGIKVSDNTKARIIRAMAQCYGYTVPYAYFIPDDETKQFEFYDFGNGKKYMMAHFKIDVEYEAKTDYQQLLQFLEAD